MKESNILKLIELEASKQGFITLRLNSGTAWGGVLKNTQNLGLILTKLTKINLCPAGTSDLLLIKNNGEVVFVETKTLTGKQRESQINFQNAVEKLGHKYILARSVDDVFKNNGGNIWN